MGTTLQNGVYLPNEGERNCYAGLKTNWEILDQKVADVTALQQAVAGALHREIVVSLPTTDIDPNTIYMILSGTSATENVYNEFMYVNNAWELIGTSATDLTNYYTKGDVDGLLLLKANASDLTSHTGDTTIHVTASDKSKWNTVALIKQLRLVNTQVGSATTIAFANIDDTNGIKVGDKCMDLDAKMFEITAVDTTNQTVTVGSALIDLALDANVVHTSGNEIINGVKSFNDKMTLLNAVRGIDITSQTIDCNALTSNASGDIKLYRCTSIAGASNISNIPLQTSFILIVLQTKHTGTNDTRAIQKFYDVGSSSNPISYTRALYNGTWSAWQLDDYALNSNVVHTSGNETVGGSKTFTNDVTVNNSNATVQADVPNLIFQNPLMERASTTLEGEQTILFTDKNDNNIGSIQAKTYTTGTSDIILTSYSEYNGVKTTGVVIRRTPTTSKLHGFSDNITSLGDTNRRWSKVYAMSYYYGNDNVEFSTKFVTTDTNQTISGNKTFSSINGVEPSSLSLPVIPSSSSYVDISAYLTVLDSSDANLYTPPANGYITFHVQGSQVQILHDYGLQYKSSIQSGAVNRGFYPVCGGVEYKIYVTASNIYKFWFIPCQGNI